MTIAPYMEKLLALSKAPTNDVETWLSNAESSVEFLKENAKAAEIVLFASLPCVFIHAVLAPIKRLQPPDQDDLLGTYVYPHDSWSVHESGGGEEDRVYLGPPLSNTRCKTLIGGEKLIFIRTFEGVPAKGTYTEISQKLIHAFQLHFLEEREAYCRLDSRGDIEDVIRIVEVPKSREFEGRTVVTIRARELAEYMALCESALVVFFDFTRFIPSSFGGWSTESGETRSGTDLFYSLGVMPGHASYVNGCQIIRPAITYEEIVEDRRRRFDPSSRKYTTFKAHDWKNGQFVETSCAPDATSNYFQPESVLPYDLSPVFFRAEVLHRFKADPEKFTLEDRRISCRGAWSLQTYDINEEGQVHTYLKYLSYLPYEEQLYWQSFNEWPKGPISKRAIRTDFEGSWQTEYDSVASVKSKIRQLDEYPPDWWKPRGEELSRVVHYPATTSPTEWANEILALDQLIVEGFQVKPLRVLAERLERSVEKEWGSLKLIEECFVGLGETAEEAKVKVAPFRKLHKLRTPLKGHGAVSKRKELEKRALRDSGSFRAHFADLARECDESLAEIITALKCAPPP